MSTPLFHRIGPYDVQRHIGAGTSMVFLAKDSRPGGRLVALKVVPDGPDDDARLTVAAEQRGAELQRTFLNDSIYVPRVFDVGLASGYLYIAMEYVEGEDLSTVIRAGAMPARRAVGIAIQLCAFLEELDHLESRTDGASPLTLLHNDLKPKNIRLVAGDRVKVLDFGAAKALSMSRRVTSNEFYSTPYLSPECLDSGERDRQTDAWALGVILYEMVAGHPPFRANDTRRLEDRIRSRRPPEPLAACPASLQAVIAKLLAPVADNRYESPETIREDLERVLAGTPTLAEADGFPGRSAVSADEPPTRRVRPTAAADDEAPTRKVPRAAATSVPSEPVPSASSVTHVEPAPATSAPSAVRPRRRPWIQTALIVIVFAIVANEGCVALAARRLAATVPMQEFAGLTSVWTQYQSLAGRSYLGGMGVRSVEHALARQSLVLAERVVANYRTPAPTVREAQWNAAASALQRALTVSPTDATLRGTLRYCQGQLHRINGEASKARKQGPQAQQAFAEAVSAFREAATLRPNWPDPFLGLARTFIYGIEDIDRGADAMSQAQKLGYTLGPRETAQLADGYRTRAETLEHAAGELAGMPQEREFLTRARDACRRALDLYVTIAAYADVPARIRQVQRQLDGLDLRLAGSGDSWE